ncbi:MAG: UTP--glucose-1-phosphate uridylyltransferase [Chlamydiae bacterium]|nr:UTP--glucose-1-phosphate uridylyltransferase [Chlamydiota bacterium]
MNPDVVKDLVLSLGQPDLLEGVETLTDQERKSFYTQLIKYGKSLLEKQRGSLKEKTPASLQGAESPSFKTPSAPSHLLGMKAIKNGKVACLILAGGSGTRLGINGPKGKVSVSPVLHKSLFQIQCEKVKVLSEQVSRPLQIVIMASSQNLRETTSYFEEKKYFGLDPSQVHILAQENLPFLSVEGNWELASPGALAEGPDGNGKALLLLKNSGLLEKFQKKGIEYINVILVDNPLADPFDADLIGLHQEQKAEIALKVVERESAEESVGIMARFAGQVRVVEYSDLEKEARCQKDDQNRLSLPLANIGIMSFSLSFIQRCASQMEQMPWHLAFKDAHVHSSVKKMWKFEHFIFDLLPLANAISIIKGCREDCYAPLKNAAGDKSIGTVQNALCKKYQKIYSDLSGIKAPDRVFELDPMFWYPTDEMKAYWKNRPLPEKQTIDPMSL